MVTEPRSRDPFSIVWATHGKGKELLTDSELRGTLGTVCRGHLSSACGAVLVSNRKGRVDWGIKTFFRGH